VSYTRNKHGRLHAADNFEAITGKGVRAEVRIGARDREVVVGTRMLLRESGIVIADTVEEQLSNLEAQARTAMLVAVDGEATGVIAVADPLKADSSKAITLSKEFGLNPIRR